MPDQTDPQWRGQVLDQMDQQWRRLMSALPSRPKRDLDDWVINLTGIKRDFASLYDEEKGLGIQWRWRVAIDLLNPLDGNSRVEYWREFCTGRRLLGKELLQLGTLTVKGKKDAGSTDGDGHVDECKARQRLHKGMTARENIQALCDRLTATFGRKYEENLGRPEMTVEDFTCPAHGPLALLRFKQMLEQGIRPLCSNGDLLHKPELLPLDESNDSFTELITQLKTPHRGRPIQGAYLPGSPGGLAAMAHRIKHHFEADADLRPVLLLPCSRLFAPHDYRGMDYLVHNLTAFFEQRDLTATPPQLTHDDITQQVERIRVHLTRVPCIIVLVGHEATIGPLSHLKRAIRDDPLIELLGHLVHPALDASEQQAGTQTKEAPPWRDSSEMPIDTAQFERTNFVVLSNAPMDVLLPYCRKDIPLPRLSRDHDEALINAYLSDTSVAPNLGAGVAPKHVKMLREGLENLDELVPSEDLFSGYLQLLSVCEQRASSLPSLRECVRDDDIRPLFDRLVNAIKASNSLDLLLLRIVALAGAGIRRQTLWRCAMAWIDAVNKTCPQAMPEHLRVELDDGRTQAEVMDDLLARYVHILVQGNDEPLPDLNPSNHPYEYPDYMLPAGSLAERDCIETGKDEDTVSLDLIYPEVRQALLADLRKEPSVWPCHLLHQILAAEALRQQILLHKHSPAAKRITLRDHRRALEALYNGILALPRADMLAQAAQWPNSSMNGPLPVRPKSAFLFLFCKVYRGVLDRDHLRRLTRQWAANDVKLDLLELIHSAFAPPPDEPEARGFACVPRWISVLQEEDIDIHAMAFELYAGASVAAYRSDNQERWKQIRSGLGELGRIQESRNDDGAFSVIERTELDMQMEQCDADLSTLKQRCRTALKALNFPIDELEQTPWAPSLRSEQRLPSLEVYESLLESNFNTIAKVLRTEHLKPAINWLIRLAELKQLATQRHHGPHARGPDAWPCCKAALEAFTLTLIAVKLRTTLFERLPLQASPHLSPRGARVLVKAGLELLRVIRAGDMKEVTCTPEERERSLTFFVLRKVRQSLDWYGLNASPFAPDVVSMLILEARFARTVGGLAMLFALPDSQRRAFEESKGSETDLLRHRIALKFLREAERRLIGFRSIPRLRMELLTERCATSRGLGVHLAHAKVMDPQVCPQDQAKRFLSLARLDYLQLQNIISAVYGDVPKMGSTRCDNGTLWSRVAQYQQRRTDEELNALAARQASQP